MAENPFRFDPPGQTSPAIALLAITPSDAADLARVVRDIRVGAPGDVALVDTAGNTISFKSCVIGERLGPFRVARVLATGTTAGQLVGYV